MAAPRAAFPHVLPPGHLQGSSLQVSAAHRSLCQSGSKWGEEEDMLWHILISFIEQNTCFYLSQNLRLAGILRRRCGIWGGRKRPNGTFWCARCWSGEELWVLFPEGEKISSILRPAGSCHVAPLVFETPKPRRGFMLEKGTRRSRNKKKNVRIAVA